MDPYYDSIAEGYDGLHREEQERKMRLILSLVEIRPDDLLLDVGCGTGISSGFPCRVIGLDPSAELLRQVPPTIRTVRGEAEDLPFSDRTFDIVSSLTAIQNFRDIGEGLGEIRRVGKGLFILTFLARSPKRREIERRIEELFSVEQKVEETHDVIYIARSKARSPK